MRGTFRDSHGNFHNVYISTPEDIREEIKQDRITFKRQMAVLAFIIGAVIGYIIAHSITGAVIGAIVATVARILITAFEAKHPILFKLILALPFVIYIIYLLSLM